MKILKIIALVLSLIFLTNTGWASVDILHINSKSTTYVSNDSLSIIEELLNEVILLRRQREFSKALELLPAIRQYAEYHQNKYFLEWGYLMSAHVYLGLSRVEEAEYYYRKTLTVLNDDDYESLGAAYNNLGNLYRVTGQYDKAIEYISKSIVYNEKLESNKTALAINHVTISQIYNQQLRFGRALYHVTKASELYEDDQKDILFISISNLQGRISEQVGLYDQALISFYASLETATEIGSTAHEADSFFNIATVYQSLGDMAKAQEYFTKYLPYLERMESRVKWNRYSIISNFYSTKGNHEKALEFLNIAAIELEDNTISINQVIFLRNKGEVLRRAGNYNEAAEIFEEIFTNPTFNTIDVEQPVNYWSKARNLFHINRTQAFELSELAFAITERERNDTGISESATSGFFNLYHQFYVFVANEYAKDGNIYKAADILETARARAFRDDLILGRSNLDTHFDTQSLEQIDSLRNEMEDVDRQLLASESDDNMNLLRKRSDLQARINVLTDEFYTSNPGLLVNLDLPITPLSHVKSKLGPNDAVLQFAVSPSVSFALLSTSTSNYYHQIPLNSEELVDLITTARSNIISVSDSIELESFLDDLTELLLGDLPVNSGMNLLVINDGPLHYLPTDILRKDNSYLINSVTVRYTPSLSVREVLDQRTPNNSGKVMAMVNPAFGQNNDFVALFREGTRPLPFTILEGQLIAERFGENSMVLSGSDASKSGIFNLNLKDFQYLHFGTHGSINDVTPFLSGLLFSEEANDDGYLRFSEIYNLRLNSELVMLSACNTGIGKIISGEGVMGLQRAFLYAGARNVGVSLWSIFDRSAAMIMREFYTNVANGTDNYAESLRQARVRVKNQPGFSHPVHWAPFVITGI